MKVNRKYVEKMVMEEISKTEINSMISNKIDELISGRDFKKEVKSIIADTIENLYKTLFLKKGFWQTSIK